MDFELRTLDLAKTSQIEADALLVLLPEGYKPPVAARGTTGAIDSLVRESMGSGDLRTKPGKILHLYRPAGVAARRLLLCGAGDGTPRQVRQALGAAIASVKGAPMARVAVSLAALAPQVGQVRAALLAAFDADYSYRSTKSMKGPDGKPEPNEQPIGRVSLCVADAPASEQEFRTACAVALGVGWAKEWANRPANHATPAMLARAAQTLSRYKRITVKVLGPAQVARLKMGSFMAVAQGSREPLRFIELRYHAGSKAGAPVVLVGKGITFDSGGISIKPAPEMDEMKFDMGGAASVLGVFRALAELQPAVNVIGLVPSCENMPDGNAVKPGDVVTSMSGQTIEVLNTDAEGRLILCDALTYAKRFKPRAVVDIATLTGACVVALGAVRSGMFASTDALAQALSSAGEAALDPCWRLPLDEEYAEGLKSNFADVANVAGRAAGAVTAAKFLQRFAGEFDWAHLDIAGTAWKSGAAKGATGRPVGLLVEYLLAQAGAADVPAKTTRQGIEQGIEQGIGQGVGQGVGQEVTEVDIHYNLPDKLGYACRLLRKMAGRGSRALVLAAPQELERLDRLLWTFSAHDFVAHCRADAPAAMLAASPIWLADPASAPALALGSEPVLVNLGAQVPAGFEKHRRLLDLVGQDEADRLPGRLRWKFYKERGYPIKAHDRAGEAAG